VSEERAAPSWLGDGIAATVREGGAYLATSWALARRPFTFMAEWWSGRRKAMNPLAMLATGAAIVAGARQLAAAALGIDTADSVWSAVLSALGPYVHYVAIGLLVHGVLHVLVPSSVRAVDSIAAALYAGAGPAALAEAIGWLIMAALAPLGVTDIALPIMLGAAFSVFCVVFATALAGMHRPPWWAMMLAFVVAFPVTGLVFGVLDPPGNYGLHWVIHFRDGFFLGLGL
jgi:hypothetical protein